MISAGSLSDRILFLSSQKSRGDYGNQKRMVWVEAKKKWAKVTYNKGSRAINAGEVWLPNTISILCRYDAELNERMRIQWDGKTYAIDSLNQSKKDGSCTIIATKIDEGNGTSD